LQKESISASITEIDAKALVLALEKILFKK